MLYSPRVTVRSSMFLFLMQWPAVTTCWWFTRTPPHWKYFTSTIALSLRLNSQHLGFSDPDESLPGEGPEASVGSINDSPVGAGSDPALGVVQHPWLRLVALVVLVVQSVVFQPSELQGRDFMQKNVCMVWKGETSIITIPIIFWAICKVFVSWLDSTCWRWLAWHSRRRRFPHRTRQQCPSRTYIGTERSTGLHWNIFCWLEYCGRQVNKIWFYGRTLQWLIVIKLYTIVMDIITQNYFKYLHINHSCTFTSHA